MTRGSKPMDEPVQTYPLLKTSDLLLDHDNPRLADYGLNKNAKQTDILKTLWERMAVEEVAMSIAWNGYFAHEPLFVERQPNGSLLVIEGNRRLAAVKLLLDRDLREKLKATDLPDIDRTTGIPSTRRSDLETLPCQLTTRRELWRYLGFKHVNGPAVWGSYAKAQYIAQVHNDYSVPLEDIARQIGDYNNTVERLYHGLMVVMQAEKSGVFDRRNSNRRKGFEFSHIYEALNRSGIQKFLGLDSESRERENPVPKNHVKSLGELLLWIYGDKSKDVAPRMRTQAEDIDKLSIALQSKEGVKALRDGMSLDLARDASIGDVQLFRNAVNDAKQRLQDALGLVTTGYDPTDENLFSTAGDVQNIADDIYDAMKAKRRRHKRSEQESNGDE